MNRASDTEPEPVRRKLLEQVRATIRAQHFSPRTEEAYLNWIRRYVLYHGKQHPAQLNGQHVAAFLSHLAEQHNVSSSTQSQAASALLFLYGKVLDLSIEVQREVLRPRKPRRLPVVLTGSEVRTVLQNSPARPGLWRACCTAQACDCWKRCS